MTLEKTRALTRFDSTYAFSDYIPARLFHSQLNFVSFRQNPFQKDEVKISRRNLEDIGRQENASDSCH